MTAEREAGIKRGTTCNRNTSGASRARFIAWRRRPPDVKLMSRWGYPDDTYSESDGSGVAGYGVGERLRRENEKANSA